MHCYQILCQSETSGAMWSASLIVAESLCTGIMIVGCVGELDPFTDVQITRV